MHRLMLTFISLIALALPENVLSDSVKSSAPLPSNDPIVTSSHGGHRPNESPMGQRNATTIKTDHTRVAERLARKPKHTSPFWDDFYNTATVSMWVSAVPGNTPQHKRLYNAYAGATNDSTYTKHWRNYRQERGGGPLAQKVQTQGYAEWLYIMYRIDLDGLLVEPSDGEP